MLHEFLSAIAVFVLFGLALGGVVAVRVLRTMDGAAARCDDVAGALPSCDDVEAALPEILWTATGQRIVYRKK